MFPPHFDYIFLNMQQHPHPFYAFWTDILLWQLQLHQLHFTDLKSEFELRLAGREVRP